LTPASPNQPTTTTSPSLKRQLEAPLTVPTLFTPLPQTQPHTAPKTCYTRTIAVAHSPSMQVPGKVFGKFLTHCQTIAPARRMATISSNTTNPSSITSSVAPRAIVFETLSCSPVFLNGGGGQNRRGNDGGAGGEIFNAPSRKFDARPLPSDAVPPPPYVPTNLQFTGSSAAHSHSNRHTLSRT